MTAVGDEFDRGVGEIVLADAGGTPSPALLTTKHSFGGKSLAPYSFGRRLLWRALFTSGDDAADQIYSLSLIFALSLDEPQAIDGLFNVKACKRSFYEWIEARTDAEYKLAVAEAEKILDESNKAEVRTAEEPGADLKKKP